MEIFWTAICGKHNKKLIGHSSLFMFPIYGLASFILVLSNYLKKKKINICARGLIYMFIIYIVEYISGKLLRKKEECPWDYSKSKYNIDGLIRLDYAPLWFIVGVLYEQLLKNYGNKNN